MADPLVSERGTTPEVAGGKEAHFELASTTLGSFLMRGLGLGNLPGVSNYRALSVRMAAKAVIALVAAPPPGSSSPRRMIASRAPARSAGRFA
jgi:hypothetical protein